MMQMHQVLLGKVFYGETRGFFGVFFLESKCRYLSTFVHTEHT